MISQNTKWHLKDKKNLLDYIIDVANNRLPWTYSPLHQVCGGLTRISDTDTEEMVEFQIVGSEIGRKLNAGVTGRNTLDCFIVNQAELINRNLTTL